MNIYVKWVFLHGNEQASFISHRLPSGIFLSFSDFKSGGNIYCCFLVFHQLLDLAEDRAEIIT